MLILLIPSSVTAISIDELQNAPNRYIVLSETSTGTHYIDINSIKSIRYAPPYYSMQATIYCVLYNISAISEEVSHFNYDYNRSFDTLVKETIKIQPDYTNEQIYDIVLSKSRYDSGIYYNSSATNFYDFNGQYITKGSPEYNKKVSLGTVLYHAANYIFEKYYNEQFFPGF